MNSLQKASKVIFIVGPTAIGKTGLAVKLAKKTRGEIISCDSMQIYKGMDILSQAPSKDDRRSVRHHLVGLLDPDKEYSAAAFRREAGRIIDLIRRRKKVPIVAGGSGLYVKALVDGLFSSPKADLKFRKKMAALASRHGTGRLHARLAAVDPAAAERIHPNDARRIIRALEVYHSTGRTMTELKAGTKGLAGCYRIKLFGLTGPREEIYSAIETRVDRMFAGGILREVKRLKQKKLSKTAKAVLGFKEVSGYLDGKYDLDTARYLLKRNTRHFAKRQLAWFRADKRIKWFDMSRLSEAAAVKRIAMEAT